MSFKDMVAADLVVFLNPDEFGEPHIINGKEYNVIVDNDQLKERSNKEYDGITVGEILFFISKLKYERKPENGTSMVFDSRPMFVFDAREDMGLYEIILSQNRGA